MKLENAKIFSLWQPWASFMALGYKENETRSWATNYRGPLVIHAAKNKSALADADGILAEAGVIGDEETTVGGTRWPLGEILAVVTLVDCVPTEKIRDGLSRRERAMGDYRCGRFAWVTKERIRIHPGIPFRGLQGLKPISTEGLRLVNARIPYIGVTA